MSRLVTSSVALALALALAAPASVLAQQTYGNYPPAYPPPSAPGYVPSYAPAPFTQEELDSLLAPIALYPDQLLAQILMASTYPQDVVQAARFLRQNPGLRGPALDDAVARFDWDPSVQSLTAFPQVLDMMTQRMDWTRRLGEAYLEDQDWVMDTVQDLRWRAQEAGNLASTPQQRVFVEDRTIYIEPAAPEVIYVPTYNPTVIYGPWWAPAYVPYYWRPPRTYYPGVVIGTGYVKFGVPYRVTHNHWGWARPDWQQRHIDVDVHRPNQFIERKPYYREWARDGWWEGRREQTRADAPRDRQQGRGPDAAPGRSGSGGDARRNDRGPSAPLTGGPQGGQLPITPHQAAPQPARPQPGGSQQRDNRQYQPGQQGGQQRTPRPEGSSAPQGAPVVPHAPTPQASPVAPRAPAPQRSPAVPHAPTPQARPVAPTPPSVPAAPSQGPAMRSVPPPQGAPVVRQPPAPPGSPVVPHAPAPQASPVAPHAPTPQSAPAVPHGAPVPPRSPAPTAPQPQSGGPQGSAAQHAGTAPAQGRGHGERRGPASEPRQQGS